MTRPRIPRYRAPVIPVGRWHWHEVPLLARIAIEVAIGLPLTVMVGSFLGWLP